MNGSFIGKNEIDDFLECLDKKDNSIFANSDERKSATPNRSNNNISTSSESEIIEESPYR